jgi:hypothetical protein
MVAIALLRHCRAQVRVKFLREAPVYTWLPGRASCGRHDSHWNAQILPYADLCAKACHLLYLAPRQH